MFQSTPLCEGRQPVVNLELDSETFQSTPLCEGRPGFTCFSGSLKAVSIHAPV